MQRFIVITLLINYSTIFIKEWVLGPHHPQLSTVTLLRQQASAGGSALLIRVARTASAVFTRAGTRTTKARTVALGSPRACVYDL